MKIRRNRQQTWFVLNVDDTFSKWSIPAELSPFSLLQGNSQFYPHGEFLRYLRPGEKGRFSVHPHAPSQEVFGPAFLLLARKTLDFIAAFPTPPTPFAVYHQIRTYENLKKIVAA